jgi:hypothetical protein
MLLAILVALSQGNILPEEEPPRPLKLPTDWKEGDRYRIEKVNERLKTDRGASTRTQASVLIDVVVERQNEEGFVISWTYGEVRSEGVQLTGADRKKIEFLTMPRIRFQTDASGTPQKVLNEEEFLRYWKRVKAQVAPESGKEPLPKASRALLDELLSPELAVQAALEDPREYYAMCGSVLTVAKAIEADDSLPFPLGDEALPAKEKIVLTDVDPKSNEAHVEWSKTLDRPRALPIVKRAIERAAKAAGKPAPKDGDGSAIKLDITGKFSIDMKTGLPRAATFVKSTEHQVDTTTFRRLPPAKS